MKILLVFALALATAAAFNVPEEEVLPRNRFMPVVDLGGRIAGGEEANMKETGYQVGLSLEKGRSKYLCGGSLISLEWVLTAAHCTEGMDIVKVYLGDPKRERANPIIAIKFFEHEKWNTNTIANDIALIKIPKIKATDTIWVVKLAEAAKQYDQYNGNDVIATGWGQMGDGKSSATYLQQATMSVITNFQCQKTYGSSSVTSNQICCNTAYVGKNRSTCQGDSGGPLVLPAKNPTDRVQIGLTSFGARAGCEKGYPVAFTFVPAYRDWIRQNTGV